MRIAKYLILLVVCCCCINIAIAQSPKKIKAQAEALYTKQNYEKALPLFLKYQEYKPKDLRVKYQIGLCYFNLNNPERAQSYLDYFVKNAKKSPDNTWLYLANASHQQNQFENAVEFYKTYLSKIKFKSPERRAIKYDIKRCAVGMKVKYQNQLALVENMGNLVNTSADEFGIVLDPFDDNVLFFSSARENSLGNTVRYPSDYSSDMYITRLIKGEWTATAPLNEEFNSTKTDVLQGFSEDRETLFLYKGNTLEDGQLYINTYDASLEKSVFNLFPTPINSSYWDGDLYFFTDSIILFSSNRPGGYGGKDLYVSKLKASGTWGAPKNLGANINTPFDEIAPFITRDGRTLFFSSNSLKSMGGFDVFKSKYIDADEEWLPSTNLGLPINTAANETYFKVAYDGTRAFYTSDRSGGAGGLDLYTALFKTVLQEHLLYSVPLLFTQVPENNRIVKAKIEKAREEGTLDKLNIQPVEKVTSYEITSLFFADNELDISSINQKQLNKIADMMNEYPQLKLELTTHTNDDGSKPFNLYFSIKKAKAVATYLGERGVNLLNISMKGCGANYPLAQITKEDGSPNDIGIRLNSRIDFQVHNEAGLPLNISAKRPQISELMADPKGLAYLNKIKGLSYKIQVKALKQMYNGKILTEFSDAMIEGAPESEIMRYTLGLVQNFTEAEKLRQQLVERGFDDAFVVPYINGIRTKISETKAYVGAYPDLLDFIENAKKKGRD